MANVDSFLDLDGYESSGWRNQDKFFNNDEAFTLSFRRTAQHPKTLEEAVELEKLKRHSQFCRIHPFFVRDISVLYREQEFKQEDEDFMYKYIRKLTG